VKRLLCLIVAASSFAPGVCAAQDWIDHLNVGVYGNFFHLSDGNLNLAGVGARVSVNIAPAAQLEAESAYDFEKTFLQGFTDRATGTVSVQRTNLRLLDGLFGPKLQTNKGSVRLFVTAKGGFLRFNVSHAPATVSTFISNFQELRANNVNGVFYPGGGAEAFWGPIGLRLDVGDEIFFDNGAHNNLRVSFGPTIRF
jgi:hypothetical protein